MRRRTRTWIAIAALLVVGAAVFAYVTRDASPIDVLRSLHGPRPAGGGGTSGGHGS